VQPLLAISGCTATRSGSVVFVVSRDTVAAVPLDVRRRDLAPLVDYTRDAMEHSGTTNRWRTPRSDSTVSWCSQSKSVATCADGRRWQFTGTPSVLALAPRPHALPATRVEVDAIARLFGSRATVLRGNAATKRALFTGATGRSVMHLASLGVLNKQKSTLLVSRVGTWRW